LSLGCETVRLVFYCMTCQDAPLMSNYDRVGRPTSILANSCVRTIRDLTKSSDLVYNWFTMSKRITKAFKVEPDAWTNFVKAAESYGATPAELLRELVRHVDAAMKGIESGRIQNFNGDIARLIRTEFPQLSPFQLETMASVLIQAAKLDAEVQEKRQAQANSKEREGDKINAARLNI